MRKHAFTLIELLVVVVTVGILAAILLVSYSNTQAKARDTRRIANVNEIAGAAKLYYTNYRTYPRIETAMCFSRVRSSNEDRWGEKMAKMFGEYLPAPLTTDPKNSDGNLNKPIWQDTDPEHYFYTFLSSDKSFIVAARMEVDSNSNQDLIKQFVNIKPSNGFSYNNDCINSDNPDPSKHLHLPDETFAPATIASTGFPYYFVGDNLQK